MGRLRLYGAYMSTWGGIWPIGGYTGWSMGPIGGFDSPEPSLMYCRPRFGLKCYQSDHYGSPEGSMGPIGGIGGGSLDTKLVLCSR